MINKAKMHGGSLGSAAYLRSLMAQRVKEEKEKKIT
jgi:hypothetical protein